MQGLKELKVEGLELTACLLLFSGSSLASLTLLSPLTAPLSSSPHNALYLCAPLCMIFSSLHVLIQLTGRGLKRRHSQTSAGCYICEKMYHDRVSRESFTATSLRQLPVLS